MINEINEKTDIQWKKIEGRSRLWSFHQYGKKPFANDPDPTLRFARALIASCEPIKNRDLMYEWYLTQPSNSRLDKYL